MNLSMISNYMKAKWSKGLSNKKVNITTKDIRLLGCFGDGEDVSVCPALRPSERKMGKFYCNDCNCGDKASTWLNGTEEEYTKLDHPYLSCPRRMPGFSDYVPSTNDNNIQEQRKKIIETVLGDEVLKDKNLIKPEMSDDEKEEFRQNQQEQHEKRQKDCPDCQRKNKVRQEVIKELEGQGIKEDFNSDEYKLKFQELWRVKMEQSQKDTPRTKPVDPKKLREYLKEKLITSGLADDGGEDFEKELSKLWTETVGSIQRGTYDVPDEITID